MINILGIIDKLNDFVKPVRDWLFENHNNPVLWVVLLVGGIGLFFFAYESLQKEK